MTPLALSEGDKKDIQVFKKGRRCKHCNTPMSIYTPGHYCNAHMEIGFAIYCAKKDEQYLENIKRASENFRKRKGGL